MGCLDLNFLTRQGEVHHINIHSISLFYLLFPLGLHQKQLEKKLRWQRNTFLNVFVFSHLKLDVIMNGSVAYTIPSVHVDYLLVGISTNHPNIPQSCNLNSKSFLTLLKCVFWTKFTCTAFIDIIDHGFSMIFQHPGKIWAGCPNASCHSPCPARILPSFLRSSYLVTWGSSPCKKDTLLKRFFQTPQSKTSPRGNGSGKWKIVGDTTQDVNGETPLFRSVLSSWFKSRCPFSVMKTSVCVEFSYILIGDVQIRFIGRYSAIRWGRPTCCGWSGPP